MHSVVNGNIYNRGVAMPYREAHSVSVNHLLSSGWFMSHWTFGYSYTLQKATNQVYICSIRTWWISTFLYKLDTAGLLLFSKWTRLWKLWTGASFLFSTTANWIDVIMKDGWQAYTGCVITLASLYMQPVTCIMCSSQWPTSVTHVSLACLNGFSHK